MSYSIKWQNFQVSATNMFGPACFVGQNALFLCVSLIILYTDFQVSTSMFGLAW